MPVHVRLKTDQRTNQLCNWYSPETPRRCLCAWKASAHMEPCKKSYQSAGASRGKEDPGAIISGVRQRRIIPPRLCGWGGGRGRRGVSLSARPSPVSSRRGQAEVPCKATGRARFVCLFGPARVRARSARVTQSGPRREIRAAVLASFHGQSERDAERGCSDWGRTEKVSHG